jgi:hypothetical protein
VEDEIGRTQVREAVLRARRHDDVRDKLVEALAEHRPQTGVLAAAAAATAVLAVAALGLGVERVVELALLEQLDRAIVAHPVLGRGQREAVAESKFSALTFCVRGSTICLITRFVFCGAGKLNEAVSSARVCPLRSSGGCRVCVREGGSWYKPIFRSLVLKLHTVG